jgi:hypothetical protein
MPSKMILDAYFGVNQKNTVAWYTAAGDKQDKPTDGTPNARYVIPHLLLGGVPPPQPAGTQYILNSDDGLTTYLTLIAGGNSAASHCSHVRLGFFVTAGLLLTIGVATETLLHVYTRRTT